MKKQEFIKMMVQDNETESEPKKSIYADVIECMDLALSQTAENFELPSDKTLKGAFALIEKRGRDKKSGNSSCVGPYEAAEIIAEYLGTKYERAAVRFSSSAPAKVNLDDFLD